MEIEKGGKKMRKFSFTMLIMMLFSFVVENLSGVKQVNAETTKTELINENYLKIDYDFETKDESNIWRVGFKQKSEDEKFDQRLKLKVTDEQDKTIEYPVLDNMRQKDGWLVEEKFSQSMEGQIVLSVPKSVEKLKLYVQLDQRKSDDDSAKIHEDTLATKKPFVLEMKKAKEAKQPDVKKKEEVTTASSEDFIGPRMLQQMKADDKQETMNRANLRAANASKYQNKVPEYNKDNGNYPKPSWKPSNQENVINHQGGNDNTASNVWDGLQSWDTTNANFTNSYIRYGLDDGREDIALRKYATQTAKPEVFDVRLNVRGNSITKPGVDIFFVMDNSSSMGYTNPHPPYGIRDSDGKVKGRKEYAVSSLNNLLEKFKKNLPTNSDYMRIGGVVYGSKVMSTYELSNNTEDWDKMAEGYKKASVVEQNTYTQGGLIEAQKKLQASGNDRRKIVFLLTDGAPTVSLRPTAGKSDLGIYYDNIRITSYSTNPPSNLSGSTVTYLREHNGYEPPYTQYWERPINIANINGGPSLKVQSHLDMANSEAANLKDGGIEIQTIAIGVERSTFEKHTKDELVKGLYRMATKRAGVTGDEAKDHYFYYAENKEDFDPSFNEWYDSVLSTVENGVIEDPLGDMVELVGKPIITDVSTKNGTSAKKIADGKTAILDESNPRKVRVTNINLYGNQEIQVDYKVRLKTESDNFVSNQWYQVNGKTTLQPTPDRSDDLMEFGVPSVKAKLEDFEISIEKIWEDTYKGVPNYWRLQGQKINAELQMKDPNTGAFKKVDTAELNEANQWNKTYPAVSGRSNIFRIKEVGRTPGYAPVTMNYQAFTQAELGSDKIQLTNKLLTGSTHFYKYKEDGKTPFATSDLPKFSVTHENGKLLADNLKPDSSGKVTIENIPIGTYILKEDYAPAGYSKMADVPIKVVENDEGNKVIITFADNKGAGYVIKNELKKDITIPIEKVWEDKHKETENYWGKRSNSVDFKIQEKSNNQWKDVETVTLSEKNGNWKGSFKTDKEDTVHRIVELGKTLGYAPPEDIQGEFSYNSLRIKGDGTAKIVNRLLKGEASFNKFLEDGKTPFKGSDLPKFTVRRKDDGKELVKDLTPDKDGKVTIKDIPVGEFIIEETHVTDGFKKMADISLKAVEKKVTQGGNTKYVVETTMDDSSTPINKTNKLKDYNLNIAKLDQNEAPLTGAKFKLTGPNGYSEISNNNSFIFEFIGLARGTYHLEEIETPKGYQGMKTAFQFTINLDGTVTFAEHPNVISTHYEISNTYTTNSIDLTIKNKKALPGVLPRTGGTSTKLFFKIAFGLAITAGLLSGFYWLYYRKKS